MKAPSVFSASHLGQPCHLGFLPPCDKDSPGGEEVWGSSRPRTHYGGGGCGEQTLTESCA